MHTCDVRGTRSGKQKRAARFAALKIQSGGVERIRTSAPVTQPNDLANRPLQPLEYHSVMAERVGFEPTHLLQPTGFQDRTLQPLEYLSITNSISIALGGLGCQGKSE